MISLDVIEKEISELEARDTSYATIERLAWLYICRSNMVSVEKEDVLIETRMSSEFLKAVSGKPMTEVLSVMNELMDALSVVYPKEYEKILSLINAI